MKSLIWKWEKIRTLSPRDMCIAVDLTRSLSKKSGQLLEIGVFQGIFMNTFLLNQPSWKAVGIDTYPGHPETRDYFLNSVNLLKLSEKINSHHNFDELDASQPGLFDLIHINGEHSETAVLNDIERSIKYLSQDGILVIDDIFHREFPRVSSAVYKFVHSNSISPFLISGDKIWLCFPNFFNEYSELTKNILNERSIAYDNNYKTNYNMSKSIKNYQQIILRLEPRHNENFRKANKIPRSKYEQKMKIYELIGLFLPGILIVA
jgi:hypothetical protein